MDTMMLHAKRLEFRHPYLQKTIEIHAPYFDEFIRVTDVLKP